jgi:hypothetical protein
MTNLQQLVAVAAASLGMDITSDVRVYKHRDAPPKLTQKQRAPHRKVLGRTEKVEHSQSREIARRLRQEERRAAKARGAS